MVLVLLVAIQHLLLRTTLGAEVTLVEC
jgi:hypothetical protein